MNENLVLEIDFEKDPKNPSRCLTRKSFVAERGSVVTFRFQEMPEAAIEFMDDSPFHPADEQKFQFGKDGIKKKVREDATVKSYGYTVTWPGGMGASGGEVRESGGPR